LQTSGLKLIMTSLPTAASNSDCRRRSHPDCRATLSDSFSVGRVVLLTFHEGLEVSSGDQPDLMAEFANRSTSFMGSGTSFHRHRATRLFFKEGQHLRSR
jgi:hypothetical protein